MKRILWVAVLGLSFLTVSDRVSAAPLVAGDIAIIGFAADATNDPFAWVPLVDIDGGAQIFFTDQGWTSGGTFRVNSTEGVFSWTAPAGGLSAGTVMTIGGSGGTPAGADPNLGTYANVSGDYLLSALGDNIFIFDGSVASPNFIYGLRTEGGAWDADATSNDTSALPAALSGANVALGGPGPTDNVDNGKYVGSITGTRAELLAAINDPNNWETNSALPFSDGTDDVTNGSGRAGGGGFTIEAGMGPPDPVIPEPATVLLLGLGACGAVGMRRRRARKS